MFNRERTTTRRGRWRRNYRRRRRQVAEANANTTSATNEITHTISISTQFDQQSRDSTSIGRTPDSRNEHGPHSAEALRQDSSDRETPSIFLHNGNRGQSAYNTYSPDARFASYTPLGQQNMNGYIYMNLEDSHLCPSQTERHLETSAYDGLREHAGQRQLDRNFALELWRSESVHEGPLRVIPDLSGLRNLEHEQGNWESNDQNSDTGATGGITPDRCD